MIETITNPVVPAIIPKSADHLKETLQQFSFLHEIQIDVVDGSFVPFTSWPYEPIGNPSDLAAYLEPFTVEVDLMVSKPVEAALAWQAAGAEMLVFHIESISFEELERVSNQLRSCTVLY